MDKKFNSIYSPDKQITGAQWLAEFITGRLAKSKGVDLPIQFWKTLPVWEKEYLRQLRAVNGLLKIYTLQAISGAIKTKQGQKVLSFQAKWFDDIVKEVQRKIDLVNSIQKDIIEEKQEETNFPLKREIFKSGKKSLRDKLDG